MNNSGITIYLKKKPDLLFKSLLNSKKERPVFNSFKSKSEFFNNFKQREKFYNKTKYEISLAVHASKYIDYGFKNLHIVDLNGALK